jgi:predicted transcriptional regulator
MNHSHELPKPTDAELEVLRVLWRSGAATARQVWERLNADRDKQVVYTTVLKIMQNMASKGLLRRDESARSHVYEAVTPPEKVRRSLVREMVTQLFEGSVRDLVVNALGARKVSTTELREIRQIIDRLEEEQ